MLVVILICYYHTGYISLFAIKISKSNPEFNTLRLYRRLVYIYNLRRLYGFLYRLLLQHNMFCSCNDSQLCTLPILIHKILITTFACWTEPEFYDQMLLFLS